MSKNKDKKVKEVKAENKTPSAEVSENGAEVETEAGKEEVIGEVKSTYLELLKCQIKDYKGGELAVDQAANSALADLQKVEGWIKFIEKALSEKKK